VEARVFLTTQPGWAFATVAELRARGLADYVPFFHRDSSLLVPARRPVLQPPLATPADVYGCLLAATDEPRADATAVLARTLAGVDVRWLAREVRRWLAQAEHMPAQGVRARGGPGPRGGEAGVSGSYSIGTEVWGETALHRRTLAERIREAMGRALPRWEQAPSGGVRLLCKGDTRAAFLGVQLYGNVAHDTPPEEGRHGVLRAHLACGLLALAGVQPGDAVLDPFMGTGSILAAAAGTFGAGTCIGAEIDAYAYRLARQRVRAPETRLVRTSFERLDVAALPRDVRLVSNLPFGVQFAPVPTGALLDFLARIEPRVRGAALLLGRTQAADIGHTLGFRVKHVLVLGQPAAIAYA
jgi:hypothetical protein